MKYLFAIKMYLSHKYFPVFWTNKWSRFSCFHQVWVGNTQERHSCWEKLLSYPEIVHVVSIDVFISVLNHIWQFIKHLFLFSFSQNQNRNFFWVCAVVICVVAKYQGFILQILLYFPFMFAQKFDLNGFTFLITKKVSLPPPPN